MIVFDLKCGGGHVFEAWFASSDAYASQRDGGLIDCPVCGDSKVDKAVMAPNVAVRTERGSPPAAIGAMMAKLAAMQADALKSSRWVGRRFAAEARAMHEGEAPHEKIHGQATAEEARALHEDGVAALPLLVPVVPPETLN